MFFSKGLYFQGIKKIRTSGAGFAAIIIGLNLLYAFVERGPFTYNGNVSPVSEIITGGALAPYTPLMLLFSYAMVTSMFSFLNKRNGSDFLHSVPHKRICVYISLISAVCTWIVGIVFLTMLLNAIIFSTSPYYTVPFLHAFLTFLGYSVSALVVASVTAVCRMLSGTEFSCFLYSVSLLATPRLLILILKNYSLKSNPSVIEKTWFKVFHIENSFYFPFLEIMNNEVGSFGNVGLVLFLLAEAVLFFTVAAFLYVRRKSQIAGESFSLF